MRIEKLKKEDFPFDHISRGSPVIRFCRSGAIILSHSAAVHLGLIIKELSPKAFGGITICHDKDDCCEFFIMRDDDGWVLRYISHGQLIFNNACLSRYIIGKTFEKCAHAAGVDMPKSYSFLIAPRPVDDDKNKYVFALLRKKV